ncbi:MAG: molybdate ABC transporter substrate-binding protein [Anaerolineales bacterium]|nr:molybdate ABC transporter substrate-binding protein [Anaerolineales bacterium]
MKRTHWSRLFFPALLALVALLAGCAAPASGELTVFAASSLSDAFTEMAAEFTAANPGSTVQFNFGGSSQLATQLAEGAPADVFASANQAQMNNAVAAGRISGEPVLFLTNRLTIIVPADNPAGINTPADLAKPGLRLILAAPDVPIREYSDTSIAALGDEAYQQAVYANLVSEEPNVRQVAAKVALGEADAGIVYTSDVTPDIAGDVLQIAIPDEANVLAVYPIAAVEGGQAALAQRFIDFVLSAEGQAILAKWGFGPRP